MRSAQNGVMLLVAESISTFMKILMNGILLFAFHATAYLLSDALQTVCVLAMIISPSTTMTEVCMITEDVAVLLDVSVVLL